MKNEKNLSGKWSGPWTLWTDLRCYEAFQGLTPIMVGSILNYQPHIPFEGRNLWAILICLFHQFFIYLLNDFCDFRADRLNPRKTNIDKVHSPVFKGFFLVISAFSLFPLFILPQKISLMLGGILFLCVLYSLPPFQLKKRFLLSEIIHAVYGGGYYLTGSAIVGHKWDLAGPDLYWALFFAMLFISGSLTSGLLDFDYDQGQRRNSLVSHLGKRRTIDLIVLVQMVSLFFLMEAVDPKAGWETYFFMFFVPMPILIGISIFSRSANPSQPMVARFREKNRALFSCILLVSVIWNLALHS